MLQNLSIPSPRFRYRLNAALKPTGIAYTGSPVGSWIGLNYLGVRLKNVIFLVKIPKKCQANNQQYLGAVNWPIKHFY
jgi:hypothetical protein